jgi:nicotinamide-nucleotide amidase
MLDDEFSESFVYETAIPALNSKSKTFYTSAILKTFGISADELKRRLNECVRNKFRISFRFIEQKGFECEVRIRYSNNTTAYDEIIKRAIELCGDNLYSVSGETLPEVIVKLLKLRKKKLCIAESFTGGAIVSALIAVPGASEVIKEGIVAYSNEAKQKRLNVDPKLISAYGAVSVETVYEMAANLLTFNKECDFALSTTGNAGPGAEKEGQTGLFFIGVGNRKRVHIYDGKASGGRGAVIKAGVNSALFNLYKKLYDKEFLDGGVNFVKAD